MRIIAIGTLKSFWMKHPQAETPLRAWYAEASHADWARPAEVKAAHRNASFIGTKRVIFNIKGNDYRLIVAVHYDKRRLFIRFVGTHSEYDKIDATTI
jgi:mRNA interferase HigB